MDDLWLVFLPVLTPLVGGLVGLVLPGSAWSPPKRPPDR